MVEGLCKLGFPRRRLDVSFDAGLCSRGLVIDFETGDFLKLDTQGRVRSARHGTKKVLSGAEISSRYGNGSWKFYPMLRDRKRSKAFNVFLTHFDIPAAHTAALLVDEYDAAKKSGKSIKYDFFPQILDVFNANYSPIHFRDDTGMFFPEIKKRPEKYVERREAVSEFLRSVRGSTRLFFVTNSQYDFSDFLMRYTYGASWRDFFEVYVFYAAKGHGFFTLKKPFVLVDKNDPHQSRDVAVGGPKLGGEYIGGNAAELEALLAAAGASADGKSAKNGKCVGGSGQDVSNGAPVITYVGDHIRGDMAASREFGWTAVGIVEECDPEFKSNVIEPGFFKTPCYFAELATGSTELIVPSVAALASMGEDTVSADATKP